MPFRTIGNHRFDDIMLFKLLKCFFLVLLQRFGAYIRLTGQGIIVFQTEHLIF